ncbi:CBS domain-containing protein [bacterium]|nr:CBS domain-containing protein [bacterium]
MIQKRPSKMPRRKRDARRATVADVMTQVVVTVSPETPIQEAIDLFSERHISGAPVVSKEGELLGVVSTMDVLRAESSAGSPAHEAAYYLEDELSGAMTSSPRSSDPPWSFGPPAGSGAPSAVIDIATRKVVAIDEDAPLSRAARILLELGIRRVLVTRRGKLAGLLSATDVLKWVARPELEAERGR